MRRTPPPQRMTAEQIRRVEWLLEYGPVPEVRGDAELIRRGWAVRGPRGIEAHLRAEIWLYGPDGRVRDWWQVKTA